jgi:acetyl-CoA carboxylase biotin carboxyl carrier protein
MDLEKIREFVNLAKKEGVGQLAYENGSEKIFVSLVASGTTGVHQVVMPRAEDLVTKAKESVNEKTALAEGMHEITSPFVGTFYAAPAPAEPPYVKVGDKLSSGSVLCIVEAMKIMNEIESDVSGEIVRVLVENEDLVEFGQPLFLVRKN